MYPEPQSYGGGCGGTDLFSQGLYAAAAGPRLAMAILTSISHYTHSDPCLEKMHISENVHAYTEDDDDFNIFSAQEGEWRLMNWFFLFTLLYLEDSDYPLNAPQDDDDDDNDDEVPGSALLEQLISAKLRDFVTVKEDGCIQVNMAEQISLTLWVIKHIM